MGYSQCRFLELSAIIDRNCSRLEQKGRPREPSSGLDRITAAEIDELLIQQKSERQTTVIVVTHDVHGARRVGDRFAVFDKGDLVAFGTAAEVEQSEHETARKLISES